MSTIANLVAKLTLDNSSFVNGIKDSQSKLKGLSTSVSDNLKNTGKQLMKTGGMLTVAALPVTAFFKSAIGGASDLAEQVAKTDQVFKGSSKEIHNWVDGVTDSFGIAIGDAYEYAGNYGNIFTNMGVADDMAADYSKSLVELAADQAAFNNLPTVDVLGKIQSGMTGNYMGLKSLGIVINATMVQEKALEMGLADANGEFTSGALVQARYALVLEQSQNALGQTSRESEGLAFQQKKLAAEFKNLKDELGTELLPHIIKGVKFIGDLIKKFAALSPEVKKNILIAGALFIALGPIITIIGALVTAVGFLVSPIGLAFAAIAGAAYLLKKAWDENFGGIQEKVQAFIDFLQPFAERVRALIEEGFTPLEAVIDVIKGLFTVFEDGSTYLEGFFELFGLGEEKSRALATGIIGAFNSIKDFIKTVIDFLTPYVKKFIEGIKKFWADNGEAIMKKASQIWGTVVDVFTYAFNYISSIFKAFSALFRGDFKLFGKILGSLARDLIEKVLKIFGEIIEWFGDVDWGAVGKSIVEGLWAGILGAWEWLKGAFGNLVEGLVGFTEGLLDADSPSKVFAEIGKDVVAGFAEGLSVNANVVGVQRAPSNSMKLYGPTTFMVQGSLSIEDLLRQLV